MILLLAVWGHFKANLRMSSLSAYNHCTFLRCSEVPCLLKEDPAGYHGEGRLRRK